MSSCFLLKLKTYVDAFGDEVHLCAQLYRLTMPCILLVQQEILLVQELAFEPLCHFVKTLPASGDVCLYVVARSVSKELEMFSTFPNIHRSVDM